LLFLREGNSAIHVVDARSGAEVSKLTAKYSLTDIDVTADGRYLYAADFGGEVVGYGTPVNPSWIHQFDTVTGIWTSKQATGIVYRIEAVDATRCLSLEQDQWVNLLLYDIGTAPGATANLVSSYYGPTYRGDIEYDERTGRVLHGSSGISSEETTAFVLNGNTITRAEKVGDYVLPGGYGPGIVALSSDGRYFYYDGMQFLSNDVVHLKRSFGEYIYAGTADYAFGTSHIFAADTGAVVGALPFAGGVYGVADDRNELWAFNAATRQIVHFAMPVVGGGVLANDTDADYDALSARVITQPTHGSLSFQSDGTFTYSPNAGFSGTDGFQYRAGDGTSESAVATVTLNILSRHVPMISAVADQTFYQDTTNTVRFTADLPGVSGAALTVSVTSSNNTLFPNGSIVVARVGAEYVVTIAPDVGLTGAAQFTITATSAGGQTAAEQFSVTVAANAAPHLDITKVPALSSVREDAGAPLGLIGTGVWQLVDLHGSLQNVTDADEAAVAGIAVTGIDSSQGTWFYSADGGNQWNMLLSASLSNSLLLDGSASLLYFKPNANFSGTIQDAIRFRAWDETTGLAGTFAGTSFPGGGSAYSVEIASASITVRAVNDAPILNAYKDVMLHAELHDSGTPIGAVGTLVSQLIEFASSGARLGNLTDADAGASPGIAVTAADTSRGAWYYSLDNGAHWLALGTVSNTLARCLAADAATRLYFKPTANYTGTLPAAITFRAWDRTFGGNGSLLTTISNGGETCFSAAVDTASLTISPNTAPTLNVAKSPSLPAIYEDSPTPAGAMGTLVSSLVDLASSAGQLHNVADPDASALPGIAVTAVNAANGSLYYSLNNGAQWLAVGNLGNSLARVLAADATTRIYFKPNADYSGSLTSAVTFRAWDRTFGPNGSLLTTVDNGGNTCFSAEIDTASLTVVNTNDAPTLDASKHPVLNSIAKNSGMPVGSVGTLVSTLVNLASATTPGNVTDRDPTALTGIAVTAASTNNGTWYYSVNNGAVWLALGSVGNSAARLLAADAATRLYFRPNSGFQGTVNSALTFRAWDRTQGTNGGVLSTSVNGGASAFSTAQVTASLTII
jgi:hypothetical protein